MNREIKTAWRSSGDRDIRSLGRTNVQLAQCRNGMNLSDPNGWTMDGWQKHSLTGAGQMSKEHDAVLPRIHRIKRRKSGECPKRGRMGPNTGSWWYTSWGNFIFRTKTTTKGYHFIRTGISWCRESTCALKYRLLDCAVWWFFIESALGKRSDMGILAGTEEKENNTVFWEGGIIRRSRPCPIAGRTSTNGLNVHSVT